MPGFEPQPFHPRRFLRNGHLQTIAGNYLRRTDTLPPSAPEFVEVEPATPTRINSRVLCHCHWQPPSSTGLIAPAAILLHGLEGSSQSQYVVGNANKLWRAGLNVIRMNMRNCGGTERLSPTLYHSGLSGDILAVLHHFVTTRSLTSVALVGYSMGGNLVLKLAGELGTDAPPQLHSVVGVSPALDLAETADLLHRPINRIYERKFLRNLLKRYRRKAALFPEIFNPARAAGIRSLRAFDDRLTAFYCGFTGAADYYDRAGAARVLDRIRVPTLILHAADDPFVHITPASRALIAANPAITWIETAHGGHCAFLAKPKHDDDGYWAESTLLRFLFVHA